MTKTVRILSRSLLARGLGEKNQIVDVPDHVAFKLVAEGSAEEVEKQTPRGEE